MDRKSELIKIISRKSKTKYNECLLDCMDKYGARSTQELTEEMLFDYISSFGKKGRKK